MTLPYRAMSLPSLSHLGESQRQDNDKIELDLEVKVKRTNAVIETVKLSDELLKLIDSDHPHTMTGFSKSASFKFYKAALHELEGFPEKARQMLSSQVPAPGPQDPLANFAREGQGLLGEQDVSLAVSAAFRDSVAFQIDGLKLKPICEVVIKNLNARKNLQYTPKWERKELDKLIIKVKDMKDSELDHLLVDSDTRTVFNAECKTWPQTFQLDPPGPMPVTLKEVLDKADEQLQKGNSLYNLVLGPVGQLSPAWRLVSVIALPNVPDKNHLRGWGVQEDSLRYILTKKEIQDGTCQWKKDMKLSGPSSSMDEFKRVVGLIQGAKRISFQGLNVRFSSYSRAGEFGKDVMEAVDRTTGQGGAVVGVGGWSGDIRGGSQDVEDLRGKELGHVW